eukprot:GFUD01092913.1.p1 GENE.GFUD01092913.1~~GFUD01092913.1.p1  ORF type:complete len:106 (+),score=21.21 GFUD01092913.1:24-341(+)
MTPITLLLLSACLLLSSCPPPTCSFPAQHLASYGVEDMKGDGRFFVPEYYGGGSQDFSSPFGLGLGLFSRSQRSQAKPDAFVRKYREDRPVYMTNHADAAMRSLG